jgi:hypothetical protein
MRQRGWASPSLATALVLLVLLTLCSHAARAEVIAYDPFNQNVENIDGRNINGTASSGGKPPAAWPVEDPLPKWEGLSTTGRVTIQSESLTYGSSVGQGGHAELTGGSADAGAYASRFFGKTYGKGTNLWLSFLMQGTATSVNEGLYLYRGEESKLFVGHYYRETFKENLYCIEDARVTTFSAGSVETEVDAGVHFFVVHLNIPDTSSNPILTLWLDPDVSSLGIGAAPTGDATASLTLAWENGGRDLSFDRIRLYSESDDPVRFDEFRMGDSWRDVSPTVPEPSSLVLSCLLLSLGIVFGWRRRKQSAQAARTTS